MSGIKPLIILTVASFYLAIMPWGKRAYQFVPYAMLPKASLKNGRLIRTAIGTEPLRKFLPIVGLYTLNRAWESPDQMLKEQGRGIGTVFLKRFHKTPSGVFINGSVLIETLPLCFSQGMQRARTSHQPGFAAPDKSSAHKALGYI